MAMRADVDLPGRVTPLLQQDPPHRRTRLGVPRTVHRRYRQARFATERTPRGLRFLLGIPLWMFRGYNRHSAGDLAAAVAFNALVAFVPMCLLFMSLAGIVLQRDDLFVRLILTVLRGLPEGQAEPALRAIVSARENSTWYGLLSLVGFLWVGSNFVSCLSRTMNRVYGVNGCGIVCERKRGFFLILVFAVLFLAAALGSTLPSLFLARNLPYWFEEWRLASGYVQLLSYGIAVVASFALFGIIYRVLPNAGQRARDIWPGTLTAGLIFVVLAQVFPIYLRVFTSYDKYGQLFGFVTLLVAWFYALAHTLVFGCFVNATYHRFCHGRRCLRPTVRRAVETVW